jgi:hypothetical protein
VEIFLEQRRGFEGKGREEREPKREREGERASEERENPLTLRRHNANMTMHAHLASPMEGTAPKIALSRALSVELCTQQNRPAQQEDKTSDPAKHRQTHSCIRARKERRAGIEE